MNIGKVLKSTRKKRNLTLQQVAKRTGVSAGLISKIENLRTTPSLPVLLKIMQTLNVDLSELDLNAQIENKYVLVKNGTGILEEREDSESLEYTHLFSKSTSDNSLRVYMVRVKGNSLRKQISTNANELVYVLSGRFIYTLGEEKVEMEAGDLLFFDGNTPHGLINETEQEAVLFKIYLLE